MPPEMASGDMVDSRADLYSLGATFYHLLSGRPPFESSSFAVLIAKHISEEPQPLSKVAPHVDPRLCVITDRLLRKDPAARYRSAEDLLDALEVLGELRSSVRATEGAPEAASAEASTPTLAPAPPPRRLALPPARSSGRRPRSGALTWVAAAGIAVVLIALGVGSWMRTRFRAPTGSAVEQPRDAVPAKLPGKAPPTRAASWRVYGEWPFDAAEAKRRQEEAARVLGVTVERDLDLGNGVKMTLVLIPAGEFLMGSPSTTSPEQLQRAYGGRLEWSQREFPQHRVTISRPFWLGKTEVTQTQWEAVMGNNPSKFKGTPQNPVEQVSWQDCQAFMQKLSAKFWKTFRLPTEAEWEYACRAGTATQLYCGDSQAALKQHAWFGGNSGGTTHPVGEARPNGWGLHDMYGNVWEWCDDWFGTYGEAPQVDPKGPGAGGARVIRGGCCNYGPWDCRSAYRLMTFPADRRYTLGCRVRVAPGHRPGSEAPAPTLPGGPQEWVSLFDGKTLDGWKVADEGDFAKHGRVEVDGGRIVLASGAPPTGIASTLSVPTADYELSFEAMRAKGSGWFAAVAFPMGGQNALWAIGRSKTSCGLAQVDNRTDTDPANPTHRQFPFENGRWYRFRLRVERERVQAWVDDNGVVDLSRRGHRFWLWDSFAPLKPLGFLCWDDTEARLRNIRLRRLGPEEGESTEKKPEHPATELKLGDWVPLFDGKTLGGWRVAEEGWFARHGDVRVDAGRIVLKPGGLARASCSRATCRRWTTRSARTPCVLQVLRRSAVLCSRSTLPRAGS